MKKITIYSKRIALIVFSLGSFWMGESVQAAADSNDCSIYANTDAEKYPGVVEEWLERWELPQLKFFTPQDLTTVVLHHQMSCCEDVLKEDREICQQAKESTSDCKNCYAHSNYLYDHLVNIGMRKFDGIQEHCDELHISCTMANSTVKTLEWRERITEIAEDVKGYPPSLIMEEFLKHRGDGSKEAVTDPNTIANAYRAMCEEAQNIFQAIGVNQQQDSSSVNTLDPCYELVRQRYLKEYRYVRTLMVDKGVQYFTQNTNDYLQEYFVKNRMSELVNKYARMDNCFTTVLRYATKTSCCNE